MTLAGLPSRHHAAEGHETRECGARGIRPDYSAPERLHRKRDAEVVDPRDAPLDRPKTRGGITLCRRRPSAVPV